jgi:hypothetical protein
VVHIATDTAPATLVLAEPIARVVHYRGVLDKGSVYFSFWITPARRISRLSLYLD